MNARTLALFVSLAIAAPVLAAQPQPPLVTFDKTGSTAKAPTTTIARDGCVTTECHPGIKSKPQLHGPVRVNACDACHTLSDPAKHEFKSTREQRDSCTLCHAQDSTPNSFKHSPYTQGECLACHDPHGSTEPRMLRGERYADSCAACHADVTGAHDRVHGPASVGACGACHEPHESKFPKLLNKQGRDLCLRCHVRIGVEIDTKPFVHAPALGDCGVCHAPHATDYAAILITDPVTLCTSCHQDIASTINNASTQHAAVTTKRACVNCHSPHAGDHASLLKDTPQNICFECHNQAIKLPDGSSLVNMKTLIQSGKSLHGAVTQRGCVECHEIHGGGHRRLLRNEYPSDLYYPFNENSYALCFSCHDKQLVLESRTSGSTGFRNGSENLHFVHVSKDKKGRSCRVCHDAHAATHDKHIRDDVAFGTGGWKLPIRYESLPNGGKCGGACHAPFEYNRVTPVVYPASPPSGAWKGEDMIPGSRAETPTPNPPPPTK